MDLDENDSISFLRQPGRRAMYGDARVRLTLTLIPDGTLASSSDFDGAQHPSVAVLNLSIMGLSAAQLNHLQSLVSKIHILDIDLKLVGSSSNIYLIDLSMLFTGSLLKLTLRCGDVEFYHSRLFSTADSLDSLRIIGTGRIMSLEGFPQLEFLRSLDLSGTNLHSLQHISHLHSLRELNVSNTKITTIKHLRDLVFVGKLDISHTSVSRLNALRNVVSLNYLNIAHTPIPRPVNWLPNVIKVVL